MVAVVKYDTFYFLPFFFAKSPCYFGLIIRLERLLPMRVVDQLLGFSVEDCAVFTVSVVNLTYSRRNEFLFLLSVTP